ncbi:MAG: haloacid dehalogenase-like hydrolase [Solirubrobacteraceae bacterium]
MDRNPREPVHQPLLLLFDIDGTLVGRAAGAHSEALRQALREVHGVDTNELRSQISPAGRTDGEIARLLLLRAGVTAERIDERAVDVREACCAAYARLCPPDLSDKVLPGVSHLLEWLSSRPDVRLSLVTGNFEPVARLKLRRAGLGHYFPAGQGAFGSDSEDRAALPPIARRRAGSDGVPHARARTIVIGDTPRDIVCARADDVRCLAVATGPYEPAELADADAVARDAVALRPLLEALLPV